MAYQRIKLTEKEIKTHKERIDKMSHLEMAEYRMFAPMGHIYFRYNSPLYVYFENRFQNFGGLTEEIKKEVNDLKRNRKNGKAKDSQENIQS